jgi:hypothetical protein
MTLIHYSYEPLNFNRDWEYHQPFEAAWKPVGFWLSVDGNDDGWAEWCEREAGWTECIAHRTEFELSPSANILYLTSSQEIDNFTRSFRAVLVPGLWYIDWQRVAKVYDGIIIAPYQWSRRLEGEASQWYYAWDCASGCVWNLKAVRVKQEMII